jgi:hypothetical protein
MDGRTNGIVAVAKEEQRERLQSGDVVAGRRPQLTRELSKAVSARSANVEEFALVAPSEADANAPTDEQEAAPARAAGRQPRLREAARAYRKDTAATRPAPVVGEEPTRNEIAAGVPVERYGQFSRAATQPAAELEVTVLLRSPGRQREP